MVSVHDQCSVRTLTKTATFSTIMPCVYVRVCVTGGRATGEQRLNGKRKGEATLARVMGYVEQNDVHTPALTVIESLRFSAHLRLGRNVNKRSEVEFVDNVSVSLCAVGHATPPDTTPPHPTLRCGASCPTPLHSALLGVSPV